MTVSKLFASDNYPYQMVCQMQDGSFKRFQRTPIRVITEKDLLPFPFYQAVGNNSVEAEPYMYDIYGLNK